MLLVVSTGCCGSGAGVGLAGSDDKLTCERRSSGNNVFRSSFVGAACPHVLIIAKSLGESSSIYFTSLAVISFPVSTSSNLSPFVSSVHHPMMQYLNDVMANFPFLVFFGMC